MRCDASLPKVAPSRSTGAAGATSTPPNASAELTPHGRESSSSISPRCLRPPGADPNRRRQNMALRVVQWATGSVGRAAIECIGMHPELELVGCWVHSKDKDGRDVGEIVG